MGLLTAVVFLPLLGALAIGFSPARWARILALGTAPATWVVSLVIASNFHATPRGFKLVDAVNWIPLFGLQYKPGVDGLSLACAIHTTTRICIPIPTTYAPNHSPPNAHRPTI